MTSRERVVRAVNHQSHDRIPIDLGGTFATSLTVPAYVKLCAELGVTPKQIRVNEPMQMLVEMELPLLEKLPTDTIALYLGGGDLRGWQDWTMPDGTTVQMSADLELRQRADGGWDNYRDGKQIFTMAPGGYYFDPVEYPKWRTYDPAELTDEVLRDIENRARICHEQTDLAVCLNVAYTIFNGTSPEFLCALITDKDEVHERLEIWREQVVACLSRLLDAVKDYVQIMVFSGDAGSQKAPVVGPDLYREMFLPNFKAIPACLHEKSDIKFLYHSCGSVYRLMEPFVELGVDALNPLQVSAAEMEPERLVQEFGGRLVFWGGGCDTQRVLPERSEEEVRAEVRSRLEHYATVPGFVFAQVHNIQPDVPPKNVLAMLDEVTRWRF